MTDFVPHQSGRHPSCPGVSRRSFLADTGMGITGLALGAMLFRDGIARAAEPATALAPAKARSVIWIFLCGGVSHVESFDVKPDLTKYAGKSIDETPYQKYFDEERALKNLVGINPKHKNRKALMGLNTGYRPYGQCGLVVGDWFSKIGECADDLAVVRTLWTIHNDHGTQLTWHTGRHPREGGLPTIGSWISYGLGSLNDNLPEYVVLGEPTGDCCGGSWTHGAGYLGPEFSGVRFKTDGSEPLAFVKPAAGMHPDEQAAEFSLIGKLNHLAGIEYPDDPKLRARIKSYELAFGMQAPCPKRWTSPAKRKRRSTCMAPTKIQRGHLVANAWRRGGSSSAECASCSYFMAVAAAVTGTHMAISRTTTRSSRRRSINRSARCSRISSDAGCSTRRWLSSAPNSAARRAPRVPAATTIRKRSAHGSPGAESKAASLTARLMSWVIGPTDRGITSPTFTPP